MILAAVVLLGLCQGQSTTPPAPEAPRTTVPAAPASSSQAPAGSAGAPAGPTGWRDLDRVILIVNEEMLTFGELTRALARENRARPFASENDANEVASRFQVARVREALRIQAGQDLGLDPTQVDRLARDNLDRRQEEMGGSAQMAAFLEANDMTLYEMKEFLRDRICAEFWDNYITGGGSVGQQARPSRDAYVRPGYLLYAHRQCLEHPELLPRIGGQAQAVVLQQLFLDASSTASAGNEDAARALAEDLRQRIVGGEDMAELVEKYNAFKNTTQKQGLTEPLVESRLQQLDPSVAAFVAESKPGDVSEVLDYRFKDHDFLRIVRLVERTTPSVPDLATFAVQKKISERIREDLSEWRLEQAFKGLFRDAYVWPQEFASR